MTSVFLTRWTQLDKRRCHWLTVQQVVSDGARIRIQVDSKVSAFSLSYEKLEFPKTELLPTSTFKLHTYYSTRIPTQNLYTWLKQTKKAKGALSLGENHTASGLWSEPEQPAYRHFPNAMFWLRFTRKSSECCHSLIWSYPSTRTCENQRGSGQTTLKLNPLLSKHTGLTSWVTGTTLIRFLGFSQQMHPHRAKCPGTEAHACQSSGWQVS